MIGYVRKRIDRWCSVLTGKSQPLGILFQWEMWQALFSHWNAGPSGWDFPVPTEHQWWILFIQPFKKLYLWVLCAFCVAEADWVLFKYFNFQMACNFMDVFVLFQKLTNTVNKQKSELKHTFEMQRLEQTELDSLKSQHAQKLAELEKTQRALLDVRKAVYTIFNFFLVVLFVYICFC